MLQALLDVEAAWVAAQARAGLAPDGAARSARAAALPDGSPVDEAAVTELLDPAGYLGANDLLIDRVLERHHRTAESRPSTIHPTPGESA